MNKATYNRRIASVIPMPSPEELALKLPLADTQAKHINHTRENIANIIHGHDKRLLVIVGPCSIHDTKAAMEYAQKLMVARQQYAHTLEIVMRVYFEKPRTIVGWKGLINDPHMDNTFDIGHGLYIARKLLIDLASVGMPAACEFLDAATGQYYADTVSWGAIGARTTESQVHREIASGLSCPVGFKNATSGDVQIAIDALQAASHAHAFLSPTAAGKIALFKTTGNSDAHIILRGGKTPNYDSQSVAAAISQQAARQLSQRLLIDCSHANSNKDYKQQAVVASAIANRLPEEHSAIAGIMLESHLVEGKQSATTGAALHYGQSVTDACMGWDETESVLGQMSAAMEPLVG